MKQVFAFIAASIIAFLVIAGAQAASKSATAAPTDTRPGECSNSIVYTQRFQFMPTAFDANEYLKFITAYHGCGVLISPGHEDGTNRDGYYIWYQLPPLH